MLDKKKIRLMTRLAAYDKKNAKRDLKISNYYKKDYVSFNTLSTVIWITIGYAIVAGLYALCNMEMLLDGLTVTKLLILAGGAIGIYVVLVIIYCICASTVYAKRYHKAKLRTKRYYRDLARLGKMGVKEKNKK